jgi:excisionase family DNA binding protein
MRSKFGSQPDPLSDHIAASIAAALADLLPRALADALGQHRAEQSERRDWLDVEGVADLLRCSRATVLRRVRDGLLPAPVAVGALRRWRRADVESALMDSSLPAARRKRA